MNGDHDDRDQSDQSDDAPHDAPHDAPIVELSTDVEALLADPRLWDEPSGELAERVVAGVQSENVTPVAVGRRRGTSWLRPAALGAVAAIVFLVGGIVVLSALDAPDGTDRFSADLVPTGLAGDIDGSIDVTSFASGLEIRLDAPELPRLDGGRFYEGWVRIDDGRIVPVGTFHDGVNVILWAGIERERVVAFAITIEQAEAPDSPEHRSSGEAVLRVDLAGG